MKKYIIILVIFFTANFNALSQGDAVFPNMPVRSGNNYSDVNLNTGAVNVNIPIWEASQYGLTVPISVSYYSNGIKPSDSNGLLGVWNLNVGGSITVEQRGLYDRKDSGNPLLGSGFYYSGTLIDSIPLSFVMNTVHGADDVFADSEPDIFHYNFPGGSGEFLFNNNGDLVNLTDKTLDIVYQENQSGILDDEIIITNTNGLVYSFICTGYSEDSNENKNSPFFSLFKIEDNNTNKSIEINFKSEQSVYTNNSKTDYKFYYNCDDAGNNYTSSSTFAETSYMSALDYIQTNTSKVELFFPEEDDVWNLNITVSLKQNNTYKEFLRYLFFKSGKCLTKIIKEYNVNYGNGNSEIIWEKKAYDYDFNYRGSVDPDKTDFWGYSNNKKNYIDTMSSYEPDAGYIAQLQKIKFPEGNSVQYNFELNQFAATSDFNYSTGAGLRVSRITEKDEHNNITSVTDYGYSGGKLTTPPVYYNYFQFTVKGVEIITGSLSSYSSAPFTLGGSYVNYSKVTEYIGGKQDGINNGKNGKVEYNYKNESSRIFDNYTEESDIKTLFGDAGVFTYPPEYNVYKKYWPDLSCFVSFEYNFPYKLRAAKSNLNGLLEKKAVFDKLNRKLSEKENQYGIDENEVCTGFKVYDYYPETGCYQYQNGVDGTTWYHGITFYKLYDSEIKLTRTVSRVFNKDDETKVITNSTLYQYPEDTNGHLIINSPKQEDALLSNGDQIVTKYYYPHDLLGHSSEINTMYSRNMKSMLIKTETFKNNELMSGQNTEYRFKQVGSNSIIVPDYSQISEAGNYKTVTWYDAYDDDLRLLESHGLDGIHSSVIYNTLGAPVANAVNARNNQIYHTSFEETDGNYTLSAKTGKKAHTGSFQFVLPAAFGNYNLNYWHLVNNTWEFKSENIINGSNGSTYTINDGIIDEIRVYPLNALMSTNTPEIGVGISSQTDANGITVYSEYDRFGRISKVYNQDRKLIKEYEFNTAVLENLFLNPLTYSTEYLGSKVMVTVHATVSGGNAPYSYGWEVDGVSLPSNSATASFLRFSSTTTTFTCTVTDAFSGSVTKSIIITL